MRFWIRIAYLLGMLLISACTTTQHMSKRDESFLTDYKLGATAITWRLNPSLGIRITRTESGYSTPTVTAEDRAKAQEGIQQLMTTISSLSVAEFTARLQDKGKTVVPSIREAETMITILPVQGLTNCRGSRCNNFLAVEVSVSDLGARKVVWTGGFKVGPLANDPNTGLQMERQLVEGFADAVMLALRKERFI